MTRVITVCIVLCASVSFAGPKTVEEFRIQVHGNAGHLAAWGIIPNVLADNGARTFFAGGAVFHFGDLKATSGRVEVLPLAGFFGSEGLMAPAMNFRAWLNFHEGTKLYFETVKAFRRRDPPKLSFEFSVVHPVPIDGLRWLSLGGITEIIFKKPDDVLFYGIRGSMAFHKNVLFSGVAGLREVGDTREFLVRGIVQFYFGQ